MRSASSVFPFSHSTIWTTHSPAQDYELTPQTRQAARDLIHRCALPLDVMTITSPELLIFASLYPYSLGVGRFFILRLNNQTDHNYFTNLSEFSDLPFLPSFQVLAGSF